MMNKKGLTLIELVIVLALIGILSSLLFFPILFSFENFEKQSNTVNEITTARATMDYLTKEIRKAEDNVIIETQGSSLKIGDVEYKLVQNTLTKGKTQKLFVGIKSVLFERLSNDDEIKITVEVLNSQGKIHKLSSILYLRQDQGR